MKSYYEKSDGDRKRDAIMRRRELIWREEEEIRAWEEANEKNKIQAKLEVSQPDEPLEKEADEVARKVVDGGDASQMNISSASDTVQTKSEGSGTLYADDSIQRQLDSSKGSGQAMDDSTKSEMETKMGADFSGVKIHTDSAANSMSERVNAKAFTHGQDIYFKSLKYDPKSSEGKNLLAHELWHTRQNSDGVQRKVWRTPEDPKKKKDFIEISPARKGQVNGDGKLLSNNAIESASEADLVIDEELVLLYETMGDDGWYYAQRSSETKQEGYIQKSMVTLINEGKTDAQNRILENLNQKKEKLEEEKNTIETNKEEKKNKQDEKGQSASKKKKKNKVDKTEGKENAKDAGKKKGGKKELQPVLDFADLLLRDEAHTSDLSKIETIEDLRILANVSKTKIEEYVNAEIANLNLRVLKQQQSLDNTFNDKYREVSGAYDKAISRTVKALSQTKVKAAEVKKQKLTLLKKNKDEKIKSVDQVVEQKQTELTDLGNSYAEKIIEYSESLKTEADTRRKENHLTIEKNAEDAALPYSSRSNIQEIVEQVGGLANELKGNIDEVTDELNHGLTQDASELAQKYRDDASEIAANIPQGKEDLKKQLGDLYSKGVSMFEGISDKPLADLEKSLQKILKDLLTGKKTALAELSRIKIKTTQDIQANKNETTFSLFQSKQKAVSDIDEKVNSADKEIQKNKASEKEIVNRTAWQVVNLINPAKKQINEFLLSQSGSLQSLVNDSKTKIDKQSEQYTDNANANADSADVAATSTLTAITGAYDQIIAKITEGMGTAIKTFTDGIDKTIIDSKAKWDEQLKDDKSGMDEKVKAAYEENDTTVSESKDQLDEKAKDASGDNDFWAGFWEGVGLALLVLVAIVAVVALLILLAPYLLAAFTAILTSLVGEFLAGLIIALLTVLVESISAWLIANMAAVMGTMLAIALGSILGEMINTSTSTTMTEREKGRSYGGSFVNLILTVFGFRGLPKPGALLVQEESALINTRNLFGKFWNKTPVKTKSIRPSSQAFAEFEEWYIYQRTVSSDKFIITDIVKALEQSIIASLQKKGVPQSVIDDIIIRAMYVDDTIGGNKMMLMIDDIAKNPKFKNPQDLLKSLSDLFSGNKVDKNNALNLLKELEEGKYWMDEGDDVLISTSLLGDKDQVDVAIMTKDALVEVKTVSGENFASVEDNLRLIVKKYTVDTKLSVSTKSKYPNHYGKINITSPKNPFYNSTKTDFMTKIRNGENGFGLIGDGANQIPLSDMKKVHQLHVENGTGRFVILNSEW